MPKSASGVLPGVLLATWLRVPQKCSKECFFERFGQSKRPKALQKHSFRALLNGSGLKLGERFSHVTRDDGTVTLCTLHAATVLSRNCCTDFGPLAKGCRIRMTVRVLQPHCRRTLYLSLGCGIPPPLSVTPPLKRGNPP